MRPWWNWGGEAHGTDGADGTDADGFAPWLEPSWLVLARPMRAWCDSGSEGARKVEFCNLGAIIAAGYRGNSYEGPTSSVHPVVARRARRH